MPCYYPGMLDEHYPPQRKAQCPVVMAIGRITAGHRNKMDLPVYR
ncbi:hypothetical protein [Nitrosomonas sp.]|nr:hypothetical protein [Nitrosomonas sp.]MDP2223390.1 hypothetical protein [Nitrosomonas sp.]